MTFRRRVGAVLILLGVCVAPLPADADTLEPMELDLVMFMGGVTAGSVELAIEPDNGKVKSSLRMKSAGLFKLLTGYSSRAKARSKVAMDGGEPMPVRYESSFETNNSERRVLIRYQAGDGEIAGVRNWKHGRSRKTKVPEALRLGTIDPLTAVLQFRHWIREIQAGDDGVGATAIAMKTQSRSFELFDGRRRYRLDAELLDRPAISLDGRDRPALRFKVLLETIAGFSDNDMLANWASEDGQRWIELIVTDDDNPVPYAITTKGGSLAMTIRLEKACVGDASCLKVER